MKTGLQHKTKKPLTEIIIFSLVIMVCAVNASQAQDTAKQQNPVTVSNTSFKNIPAEKIKTVSSLNNASQLPKKYMLIGYSKNTCKGMRFYFYDTSNYTVPAEIVYTKEEQFPQTAIVKKPFLTIHGNILYNLGYRSYIDTPYAASDIYQHSLQSYLDITVKDKYPVRLYFNSSFSNAPFFRDFGNINFQYSSSGLVNLVKEKLKTWADQELQALDSLNNMQQIIAQKLHDIELAQAWLNDPGTVQKIIEAKESEYLQQMQAAKNTKPLPLSDSLQALQNKVSHAENNFTAWLQSGVNRMEKKKEVTIDSSETVATLQADYDAKKKKADSLIAEAASYESQYKAAKQKYQGRADSILAIIHAAKDINTLKEKITALNIPDSVLPKSYKKLLAVRSFGIGTMPVNYSELTIKNISITGLQAEYNPSYYIPVASGFISYRFRDYIINNTRQPRQYVTALRFGVGKVDGNNIIATVYQGKKYLYDYSTRTDSVQNLPDYRLMGIALSARYQVNKNISVTGEVAKSSLPYYSSLPDKGSIIHSTFLLKEHSNEAYAFTATGIFPATHTKLSGSYRHTGNNFQSYSFFTTSASQSSWYIRANQPFFKRQLSIDASLRKNDFDNPFISQSVSSSAVFKSVQATLRMKKIPVISVGYFPSSQLTKINDEQITENLFYTLVASLSHFYTVKKTMMNTSVTYTRFYNHQTDTNFIYFNTNNISVNHSIILWELTMQSTASYASNAYYNLYSVGELLCWSINKQWRIGGGLKYNHQTVFNEDLLGWTAETQFMFKKAGGIGFYYDRGFIPGISKNLLHNDVGRITYSKIF